MGDIVGMGGAIVLLLVVFSVPLVAIRGALKSRDKQLEILRIYAARGEQPPQSVIDALTALAAAQQPPPPPSRAIPAGPRVPLRPKTRGEHFAEGASDLVVAAGSVGIAWWRQDLGGLMVLALVVAVMFAGRGAWHLVTAFNTPLRPMSGDEQ